MSKPKGIFLIAKYFMKPRDHVNTSKAGWMKDPNNIRWDESMELTRGLKNKDANAQVILNLSDLTVVRNTFKTEKSFDDVFRYYFDNYNKYLIPVMGQLHPDYLTKIADDIKREMDATPETVDAEYEEVKAE